ncbi:DNA helicase UvrD [Alcanivorax sp. 24]|uniref:DNA helicase UvrD n=1 Tax=Alcanivorax sp. 24 TaxID=2545266 RepID=UPI00105DEAF4|nr:DNA helicase UvrD [Alcanivorax sp. 24]
MDKRVIFSVAGSGKTSLLIDKIEIDSKALIVTYTVNNYENIISRIVEKIGQMPKGVRVYTYFSFLNSFCFKPVAGRSIRFNGICWDKPPPHTSKLKIGDRMRYFTKDGRIYHNRLAKLLDVRNYFPDVVERIDKFFDCFYVDEVQDFAGHDFNFLCSLMDINSEICLVGDFYQHTFDTSSDGNVNGNLYKNYEKYKEKLKKTGLCIDEDTLSKSYRCPENVCDFVFKEMGIKIYSHDVNKGEVVYMEKKKDVNELLSDRKVVKLFYEKSYNYISPSQNWGATKGLDCYTDVCVFLNNKTEKLYKEGGLKGMSPTTLNKLYVACTRAKGNVYLVPQRLASDLKKNYT